MRLLLKLIIFHGLLSSCWTLRQFWRGRYVKGGGLGDPSKVFNEEVHLLESAPSEEKWFTQQLDHFDPTNLGKTWQQVKLPL